MRKVDKNTQDIDFVITGKMEMTWNGREKRLQGWDTQIWIYL